MNGIAFKKYTSCGNSFVIVDATENDGLSESEMSAFAGRATCSAFGIGCDNLLVIQRCSEATLQAISASRGYWESLPRASQADFIFRMFEPSGDEALCCGNGLLCIADYLYDYHGIEDATVMTEIPFTRPRVRHIGHAAAEPRCWANMGHPRRIPPEMIEPGTACLHDTTIDVIRDLAVPFHTHELEPFSQHQTLQLSGYLVFTGEPHLVVFPGSGLSLPELADAVFAPITDAGANTSVPVRHPQGDFGAWLVHRIGTYLNSQCRCLFPAGININFAQILEGGSIEHRCFERGINRETLACGTGALAVAHVARQLYAPDCEALEILPHRCRRYDPNARIGVQRTQSGWLLKAQPALVFEGFGSLESTAAQTRRVRSGQGLPVERNGSDSQRELTASLPGAAW